MTRPLSNDLRERVVGVVEREGLSRHQATGRFGVAPSTAIKWVQRFRKSGSVVPARIGTIARRRSPVHIGIRWFNAVARVVHSPCAALTVLSRPKLLIIDELGYLPFEANAAHLFFQLVSRRYERGSILITSNRSVGEWDSVFGDPVVATAILDRLLHHPTVITIRGDSIASAKNAVPVSCRNPEQLQKPTKPQTHDGGRFLSSAKGSIPRFA